jgi:hypothetical protein
LLRPTQRQRRGREERRKPGEKAREGSKAKQVRDKARRHQHRDEPDTCQMRRPDAVAGGGEFKLEARLQPALERAGARENRLRQRAQGEHRPAAAFQSQLRRRAARARCQGREALLQPLAATLADDDDEPRDPEQNRDAERAD